MTEADGKNGVRYLNQVREAEDRVRKLEIRLRNLRALATDNAQHLNGPIGHATETDRTGSLTAEICDTEAALEAARNAAAEKRQEVGRSITRIENEEAQAVLMLRYVKGETYGEIARKTCLSVRRVYQLRHIGIREIEALLFTEDLHFSLANAR